MRTTLTTTLLLLALNGTVAAQDSPGPDAAGDKAGDAEVLEFDLDALLADEDGPVSEQADASAEAAQPADAPLPSPTPSAAPVEVPAADEVLPTIAVAQQPEPVPELKERRPPAQIEEIVVTATKREQSLREIPASISALTGDALERSGAQGVQDMTRMVPGMTFSADATNASKVTIRGISTTTLGNPTTGVLFNDVSFTDAYLPRVTLDPNPFDMQTVEVLKGPQGTLFGSSALNGAVRYVPQAPKFGEWETRWFAQYSAVEQGGEGSMYGAALNVPFGEELAFRGMAFSSEAPGWIDNTRTGKRDVNSIDQRGARGQLGWRPDEAWDIRLTYVWQQTEVNDVPYADNPDGELSRDLNRFGGFSDSEYQLADLVVRYAFDSVELVSDTAWVNKNAHKLNDASNDLLGDIGPILLLDDISDSDTLSQELRLVSKDSGSPWRWVIGAVGSTQDLFFVPEYSTDPLPGVDLSALADLFGPLGRLIFAQQDSVNVLRVVTDVQVEDVALFGDLTRELGDSVELSIGGRYYRSRLEGSAVQNGALVLLKGSPEVVIAGIVRDSGFNPKASLLWRYSDDVTYYAATSRGFRSGGLQPGFTSALSAKQAPERFTSDTLWNYEIGTRTQWLDNTLHADATVFYIDWTDPQILLADSVLGIPYLDNTGSVTSTGVEGSLMWLPPVVEGLSLNVSAAWIRTETAEPFVGQSGDTIPEGTQWPYAARWQTAATLAYTHGFGNWVAGASLSHSSLSGAYGDLEQTKPLFDYQQWDTQLTLANPAIRWLPEMSVTVNNLSDERGITNYDRAGVVTKVDKYVYNQPRTLLLRLSGSF